ncbi:MAG: hypothetical protein BVN29_03890 [Nitrospira sp. ST-bin5]|nr:MAG: hypothetical protein BVN29_03890 [Nitrospira sp. ST-bin5]
MEGLPHNKLTTLFTFSISSPQVRSERASLHALTEHRHNFISQQIPGARAASKKTVLTALIISRFFIF